MPMSLEDLLLIYKSILTKLIGHHLRNFPEIIANLAHDLGQLKTHRQQFTQI